PTSTIRFSAETSTAFNFPPQLPRTPLSTLAPSAVSYYDDSESKIRLVLTGLLTRPRAYGVVLISSAARRS
ncbi:hypothetical protein, partial [Burkholderia gladioli]